MNLQNLLQLFENSVSKNGDHVCFRFVENAEWHALTWNEVRNCVMEIAAGLQKLGVQKGDRVAIMSKTRYEWTLADLGIIAAGAIVVPIYESNTVEQAEYILNDARVKIIFVEDRKQFEKIIEVQDKLSFLKQIVAFTEVASHTGPQGVYSLAQLQILGVAQAKKVYQKSVQELRKNDVVSYVYTSGTTGNPKGAILTHLNFLSEIAAGLEVFHFERHYESVLFLPLAHILARVVQYFQLAAGFIQAYAESVDRLIDDIMIIKPHFMASVPRIFEKIRTRTLQNIDTGSFVKRKVFEWAWSVGSERSQLLLEKKPVPLTLQWKYELAHNLVFSKLHEKLGGRILFFISGGAPLATDVAFFFHVFNFTIVEGYGLTETTAAIAINLPHDVRLSTVGKAVPGCQICLADDGEILAKGDMIFQGYYNNPEATKEAFDEDGWFKTGDIGVFDNDGYLTITDRKKDLIITAGGKNIAPQNIENLMKSDPFISQFVVHGDRRKFLSALVTLHRPDIEKYAVSQGIIYSSYEDLISNQKIHQFIKSRIDEQNKKLAKYESIKRFAILPHDFTVESGELTPTLKVKRKVVNQKYKVIFDGFYKE